MSAPDISQLSESQQQALQTYTSVTDQDLIAAIPLLQRSEWNVQVRKLSPGALNFLSPLTVNRLR